MNFVSITMNAFYISNLLADFLVYMRQFNFVVVAFNSDLYAFLVVQYSVNSRLLLLVCVSLRGVAFVMI